MITPTVGFIVYGVHKDGLEDPMGTPFVDDALITKSKKALRKEGLELIEYDTVIASKEEAKAALKQFKDDERVDCVILFSGTWVWAAHLVGAVRDYAATGKGVLIWTHPGSQGWRPVGGLVMHGGLLEIGVDHRFVYGDAEDPAEMIASFSHVGVALLRDQTTLDYVQVQAAPIPEPFSAAFVGCAFAGIVVHRLRKRRKEAKG